MRFLFTTFEGGGHVPPALLVARRLQAEGHEVLFVSDEANRAAAEASGLPFQPWREAPNRTFLGAADDPLDDWRARFPPSVVRAVCASVITGPAAAYARDTLSLVAEFAPDAIVSNELLFGVIAAAEAAGVPIVLLTSNVWCFPTRADVPPFGPGFGPPANTFEEGRDRTCRRLIASWYDAGLADLNAARSALGLPPLARTLDQLGAVDRVVLGASRAFDYGVAPPPAPFAYAGPLAQTPAWARGGRSGDLIDPRRRNVLVAFSTTHQGQRTTVARCIRALGALDVHGVVTLGPALGDAALPSAANVTVVRTADHDELVPRCDLVISHGGHGSVLRPLMHGVPVVCIPTGRDQPDNAERIARAGAGLRLPRSAGVGLIRRAARRVLDDPHYRLQAAGLGAAIRAEADDGATAVRLIEAVATSGGSSAEPRRRTA